MFTRSTPKAPTTATTEPMLAWNRQLNRWECKTDKEFVYMSNETFQSYIVGWLACQGVTGQPSARQRHEAGEHCRKLSYFDKCPDRNVHRVPATMPSKFFADPGDEEGGDPDIDNRTDVRGTPSPRWHH